MATIDSPSSGIDNGFHDETLATPTKPDLSFPDALPQTANDTVPKAVDEVLYSDVRFRTPLTTFADKACLDWRQHFAHPLEAKHRFCSSMPPTFSTPTHFH